MGLDVRSRYLFSTSICAVNLKDVNQKTYIRVHVFVTANTTETHSYLFVIPVIVKPDVFFLVHHPVLYLQHDILKQEAAG